MPLVRIDVPEITTPLEQEAIGEVVHRALVEVAGAPADDRFQVITSHPRTGLVMDPTCFVERTERALIIQITLNAGRTTELKKALYAAIADGLHEAIGLRREDVMISLVEVAKENWSSGGGVAQYAQ